MRSLFAGLLRCSVSFLAFIALPMLTSSCGNNDRANPVPAAIAEQNNTDSYITNQALSTSGVPRLTETISVPKPTRDLAFIDLGRRIDSAPVAVTLVLRYRNQSQLDALVAAVSDSTSPDFHHFLTPQQFAERFAPSSEAEDAVLNALARGDITVTKRYQNRTVIDAVGPSAAVERFFSTEIHTVNQGRFGERYMNATVGKVPPLIAQYVSAAALSDVVTLHTFSRRVQGKITPNVVPCLGADASLTPMACPTEPPGHKIQYCNSAAADSGPLSNAYGTLATGVAKAFYYMVQFGCNGQGKTAAVVIDDPINFQNVTSYLAAADVTETGSISNEAVNGGGSGDDDETDLDVQTIAGLAPGANIIVYNIGPLTDSGVENGYNQVLTDRKANVVNSSFGQCETSNPSFESSTNAIAEQGAAEGVTFVASTGDFGSDECGSGIEGVESPAGDPYFTAMGGINFTENTSGTLETVTAGQAGCNANNVCGFYGGGGVSTIVAEPSFQQGIAGTVASGRNQPDLSLPFDTVAVYTNGGFESLIGTSWASPAFVSMILELDESNGNVGWINPPIYKFFSSQGYEGGFFYPCTSGNNIAYTCNPNAYNQAAGIGAPDAFDLTSYAKL